MVGSSTRYATYADSSERNDTPPLPLLPPTLSLSLFPPFSPPPIVPPPSRSTCPSIPPSRRSSNMSMQDKIIAITGGASGIGLATAKLLSSRGATVCIADVDPSALSAAASHFSPLNVPFTTTRVDVSQRAEVESWIDGIVAQHGRLDGAANCAGIIGKHHGTRTIADLDDEEWQRILAVNLTGIMYCLRAELRKVADSGSIVNISSVQGLMGK
jgi:NAD(P)-dependent dehydrogenase (short-subunit alcohol dehydrogenase family)